MSVASGTDTGRNVEIEWYAKTGHTYAVWFTTNLLAPDWERATWLADDAGQVWYEVAGSNATVQLVDTNRIHPAFYQLRLPPDGRWP